MLNKAQVIGNLGQDPRIATSQTGTKVASFSVATTERGYTNSRGEQTPDRTEWHNVVCFGKLAEVVERYLKKGSKVYVEGKMRTRQYNDKQNVKRSIMEINADSLEMLDSKPQQQAATEQPPQYAGYTGYQAQAPQPSYDAEDPLPF